MFCLVVNNWKLVLNKAKSILPVLPQMTTTETVSTGHGHDETPFGDTLKVKA